MVQYSDLEKLLKIDSADSDWISWVGSSQYSDKKITYSFESSLPSYWSSNPPPGTQSELETYQQTAVNAILDSLYTPWSVSYADVTNITFEDVTGASTGDIVMMQSPLSTPAITALPEQSSWSDLAGDIFLDDSETDADEIFSETSTVPLGEGYNTIMHELGHSIGLSHEYFEDYSANNAGSDHEYDSQKYTIQTENAHEGLGFDSNNATIWPSGLQLLDIAAAQELYGRNYTTRGTDDPITSGVNEANTVYGKTTAFSSPISTGTFVYTIWDGGGEDEIDASAYSDWVIIDLRQGEFSSVGRTIDYGQVNEYSGLRGSGLADDNLAISFFTVIENATGTNDAGQTGGVVHGDIIIGNAWNNVLKGLAGDDFLYGDGLVAPTDNSGFHETDMLHPDNDTDQTNDTNTYIAAAEDDSGSDHLLGGAGNDQLFGGAGQDILDGGTGNDKLYGGTNTAGSNFAERDTADYSSLGESITISKFVSSSPFDFYVTGHTTGDIDVLVDIEVIKASVSGGNIIDLSNINSNDFSINSIGNPKIIKFDDGSGNGTSESFEFQNFSKVQFNGFNNNIYMSGKGGIEVDGGGTNDIDTVYLSSVQDGFRQEGLVVNSGSVSNTVDGSTFVNIEKFANVSYAEINALGFDYVLSASFGNNVMLDYSNYVGSLTFDIGNLSNGFITDATVTNGSITDTLFSLKGNNGGTSTIIAGTNYGDTFNNVDVNVNIFSGTGNDTVYYADHYFYSGGQDTIYETQAIVLDSSFDIDSIDVYGESDGDLRLEFAGNNQITVKADSGNFDLYALDSETGAYTKVYLQEYGTWQNVPYSDLSWAAQGTGVIPGTNSDNNILTQNSFENIPSLRGYGFGGDDIITTEVNSIRGYEVSGGKGDDTITGSDVTDHLYGGVGDDTLNGGAGDDNLYGGTGNDTIDGGAGNHDHVSYAASLNAVYVDLSQTGTQNADDSYDGSTVSFNDTISNVEDITASVYDDTLIGDSNANELHGLQGDDEYTGGGGADTYFIGAGVDTINDFSLGDGDKLSVEHVRVQGFDDLNIIYKDMTTQTLAEIYVELTGEKIADVYLGPNETIPQGSFEYRSYVEPDNTTPANNTPYTDPVTGKLLLEDNYNPGDYKRIVIEHPADWGSSSIDYENPNPTEILEFAWSQLQYLWRQGRTGTFSLRDNSTYLYDLDGGGGVRVTVDVSITTNATIINAHSDDIYATTYYATSAGSADGTSSVSVSDFYQRGTGNDNTFVFYANNKDTSTSTTPYVIEDVNAGYDVLVIDGASKSDTYLTLDNTGKLIINFIGYPNYKIEVQGTYHTNHGTDVTERVEAILFDSGSTIEYINLSNGLDIEATFSSDVVNGSIRDDVLDALDGDDTIRSGDGNDILIGGGGKDNLYGGLGDDTYQFEVGFGAGQGTNADYADEYQDEGFDTVHFTGGILASDVYSWVDSGGDLVFRVGETSNDEVEFVANYDFAAGSDIHTRLERVIFDDGTIWDLTQGLNLSDTNEGHFTYGSTLDDVIDARGGNDTIRSGDGNDILIGGAGKDNLYGGLGDDTYQFEVGFGAGQGANADYAEEYQDEGFDTVHFTGGILANDVYSWVDSGGDLVFRVGGTSNDEVEFVANYNSTDGTDIHTRLERVIFDDGTIWDLTSGLVLNDTNDNHTIYGSSLNDTINGRGGNDTLYGYTGDDVLIGGAGDDYFYGGQGNDVLEGGVGTDTLYGEAGDDIYVWDVGDGNDTISENGGTDELHIHNVLASEIRLEIYSNTTLRIHIGTDYIAVTGQYQSDSYQSSSYDHLIVEKIVLDDLSEIDLVNDVTFAGTSSIDNMSSLNAGATLIGNGGDDYLTGKNGNDTYIWDVGDGNDTISESGGYEVLVLHNVLASEIRLENVYGTTLKVHIGSETITINGQYQSDYYQNSNYDGNQVEKIILDDASEIDLLSNVTFKGTNATDYMYGLNASEIQKGADGADYIYGYSGDDILYGDAGSDYLYGGNGNDQIIGGVGVDMLYGDDGADIFVFDNLTSSDNIQDFSLSEGDKLDVSDLLVGYDPLTDAITDFVQITESNGNSYLNVDTDGGADNFVQVAYIYNETGLTDEDALETSGNLIAA